MAAAEDVRVGDWVVHRPNVVRSVAARVPGIDAEEATSRALEKMVRIVSTGGTIDDPAPYWRRAAVNEAISMTRETGRTRPVEDDTLDGLTPPVAGAELDAERQADVTMLRTALSDLADDDRQLLLQRHVHDKTVTDIATNLGVRPHAVTMRLRRAEERLAGAFAAAHAHTVNEPECRTTRAAMHDYLKGRLLPRRQRRLEVHMDACTDCTRAFIDVREVSWMLRDLGQHLITGGLITTTGALTTAALASSGGASGARPRSFGKKETAVAAGVLAALAIGGGAAALIANQNDPPPVQAIRDAGPDTSGDNPPGSASQDRPPSIPPADPRPRPATTPKEDAAPAAAPTPAPTAPPRRAEAAPPPATEPGQGPERSVAPATVPRPAPDTAPDTAPDRGPAPAAERPPAAAPAEPDPEPEPEPPPPPSVTGGPPGNPDNPNGRGPVKDNGQGPGSNNGRGPGSNDGPGNSNGKGPGSGTAPGSSGRGPGGDNGPGNGNGNGKGPGGGKGGGPGSENGRGNGKSRSNANGPDSDPQLTSWFSVPGLEGAPGAVLNGVASHRRVTPGPRSPGAGP